MIAPFFIAGFDTPSDLCCRIRLYNKGLCPLTPEFIALGFRRSKKEQHQVLLLQTSNNNYGWNKYHAGIFGEVNSTPYPCKSKFKSEVWDNWNLIFQLTHSCPVDSLRLYDDAIYRKKEKLSWDGKSGTFCFDQKGKMKTGLQYIAGKTYFFIDDGYMQTGKVSGVEEIDEEICQVEAMTLNCYRYVFFSRSRFVEEETDKVQQIVVEKLSAFEFWIIFDYIICKKRKQERDNSILGSVQDSLPNQALTIWIKLIVCKS